MQGNTTKVCPKCGLGKKTRGFYVHLQYCKGTLGNSKTEKVRYPKQKAIMSPEAYAKFLRKADGLA